MATGYYLFDNVGPTRVPTREQVVRRARQEGTVTVLMLDANVCLDLAHFATDSLSASEHKSVIAFLGRVKRSGTHTAPGLGLAELSLDRATFRLDPQKLVSFETKVSYSLNIPASRLTRPPMFRGDTEPEPPPTGALMPWLPVFQLFYACILKILLVSKNGLGRDMALGNVATFATWMCRDLDVFTALPLQIAYAVFGGDTKARKLVGVDDRKYPLKRAWGAAWDVFHVMNMARMRLSREEPREWPIFVTRDVACFQVFSRTQNVGGVRLSPERTMALTGVISDYPHFESNQEALANVIKPLAMSRIDRFEEFAKSGQRDSSHFPATIAALERELAVAP